MQLNSDFTERVVILPEDYHFSNSPLAGVSRMMFDRAGDEVAMATSIVRYEAGSGYSSHTHNGGEEILVLEGVFSRSEEHTSELQSRPHLVCRLLLEKKNNIESSILNSVVELVYVS